MKTKEEILAAIEATFTDETTEAEKLVILSGAEALLDIRHSLAVIAGKLGSQ